MKKKESILLVLVIVFAVVPLWMLPWFESMAVSEKSGTMYGLLYPLYQLLFVAAAFIVLCMMIKTLNEERMDRFLIWLLPLVLCFACLFTGVHSRQKIRMQGMAAAAERSQNLIAAIEQFEFDEGQPPRTLSELVPAYLPEIPGTGMQAYPAFEYYVGDIARERYVENPWVLRVFTPQLLMSLDELFYLPRQNYAEYGASVERVGDWAYLHE